MAAIRAGRTCLFCTGFFCTGFVRAGVVRAGFVGTGTQRSQWRPPGENSGNPPSSGANHQPVWGDDCSAPPGGLWNEASVINATPITTAMSATLNTGQ